MSLKLKPHQVWEIRRRHEAGETQAALARELGIHRGTVQNIVSGRNWPYDGTGRGDLLARRRRALARILPAAAREIAEAFPDWYGGGIDSAGERRKYRDLRALGARRVSSTVWAPPEAA